MGRIGPEFIAQLLDEHGPALVLYARQRCAAPEDVVQEAFVLLMRQPEPPTNVVGWLYRVVRNGAISAARAESRRGRREAAVAHAREPWFEEPHGQTLDATAATAALAELPVTQREAIVARLWGGRSLEEIAGLLGASVSTVHRWYYAGLEALRERLGENTCPTNRTTNR